MHPFISSVTSSSPDGIYKARDNINITVNFSEPVILTGTFSLKLNSGATAKVTFPYLSTETSVSRNYLVGSGDSSTGLNATSISLSGILQDELGADANLTLPAQNLANTKNIVVDGIAPNAPIISGIEKTYNSKPVWIISSGGGGNGTFRYKINDSNLDIGAMTKTSSVPFDYQPSTDLTPGIYTLYVQERDDAGNWSDMNSAPIEVVSMPAKKILVNPGYLFITESGASEKFTVRLAAKPDSDVRIGISSDNTAACKVSMASITFTPGNWDIYAEVSVTDISTGSVSQSCNIVFTPQSTDQNFNEAKPDPLPVNILKAPDLDKMKSKKAIIVTGGGSSDFLWQLSKSCTDMADKALRWQGYTDADIMYLSENNPDPARKNTLANFEYAVKTWGHEPYAGTEIDELLIYMTGHGDIGTFTLNNSGILSAGTLKSWLDTLQINYPKIRVILIYDACYSGSFANILGNIAHQRIIITSAGPDQVALFGDSGKVSFSAPFWNAVMVHGMLRESYDQALKEMMDMKLVQTPVIAGMPVDDLEIGWGRRQGSSLIGIGTKFPDMNLNCDDSATVWVSNFRDAGGNDCSDSVQNVYVSVHYFDGKQMSDIISENDHHL
ncbi:MAG: hypothetical protein HC887_02775, partial [Desulfobacteraceae bacterium]|nr:hypothetical protein [Desulfobacteraceae bacterium]